MSLTKTDLSSIKKLFDVSFDEHVPAIIDEHVSKIVQPMLDKLEERLTHKIDELTLSVGQFSLETTNRIDALDTKLSAKIDNISERLEITTEMADTNRVEIAKVKRKLGST